MESKNVVHFWDMAINKGGASSSSSSSSIDFL
jgi:hypothetical protein